jgi:hypothetical protein
MHGQRDVVAVGRRRRPRVQAHANLDLAVDGPRMRGEGELSIETCEYGVRRILERDEKGVPLSLDLDAMMSPERIAKQLTMVGEQRRVLVAQT